MVIQATGPRRCWAFWNRWARQILGAVPGEGLRETGHPPPLASRFGPEGVPEENILGALLGFISGPNPLATAPRTGLKTGPGTLFGPISAPKLLATGLKAGHKTGTRALLGPISGPNPLATGRKRPRDPFGARFGAESPGYGPESRFQNRPRKNFQ